MEFEWDVAKEKANRQKHGISFGEACHVFADKYMLTLHDESHSNTEERWITMGHSNKGRLLVVIHTYRERSGEEAVRIISARKANKLETSQYLDRMTGRTKINYEKEL